jgi:hypothetical protein
MREVGSGMEEGKKKGNEPDGDMIDERGLFCAPVMQ